MLRMSFIVMVVAVALAGCGGGGGATATPSPIPGGSVQGYPADVTLEGAAATTPEPVATLEGYP